MQKHLLPIYFGMFFLLAGCAKDLNTYRLSDHPTYLSKNGKLLVYGGVEGIRLNDGTCFRISSSGALLDPDISVAGDETVEPLRKGR